jgi:ribonuclease HI
MINIYTDGSCIGQKGGWAYIIINDEENIISNSGRVPKNATNNRMELTACLKAIEKIIELKLNGKKITIFTDSQYVITVLSCKKQFTTNEDLITKIRDILHLVDLEFKWVKAHSDNFFNESVDIMARNKAKGITM